MSEIEIKMVKKIREDLGMTHLVIFGVDLDGVQHVATHGRSKLNAVHAAKMGDDLKKALGWPPSKPSTPTERICGYCDYVSDSVSGSGSHWYQCMFERKPVSVEFYRVACGEFVPKY